MSKDLDRPCFFCGTTEHVKLVDVEVSTIAGKMRDTLPLCYGCKAALEVIRLVKEDE